MIKRLKYERKQRLNPSIWQILWYNPASFLPNRSISIGVDKELSTQPMADLLYN